MLDSSGKLLDGIFSEHLVALGNIHECMDIHAKNIIVEGENIGNVR